MNGYDKLNKNFLKNESVIDLVKSVRTAPGCKHTVFTVEIFLSFKLL